MGSVFSQAIWRPVKQHADLQILKLKLNYIVITKYRQGNLGREIAGETMRFFVERACFFKKKGWRGGYKV